VFNVILYNVLNFRVTVSLVSLVVPPHYLLDVVNIISRYSKPTAQLRNITCQTESDTFTCYSTVDTDERDLP